MDPCSLPRVIADDDGTKHVVVEGNRRIVVLRLLHNPQLLEGVWSLAHERKLKELSQKFKNAPISSVQCVVLADREEADHWIHLSHRGANNRPAIASRARHAIAPSDQPP